MSERYWKRKGLVDAADAVDYKISDLMSPAEIAMLKQTPSVAGYKEMAIQLVEARFEVERLRAKPVATEPQLLSALADELESALSMLRHDHDWGYCRSCALVSEAREWVKRAKEQAK